MIASVPARAADIDHDAWERLIDSAQSGPRMMRDLLIYALAQVSYAGSDVAELAATAALQEILHYPANCEAIAGGMRPQLQSPSAAALMVQAHYDRTVVAAEAPAGSDVGAAEEPAGQPSLIDKHIELERLREKIDELDLSVMCADIGIDDRERHRVELAGLLAYRDRVYGEIAKLEGLA